MKIQEYYTEAKQHGHNSLILLIEYLVFERKVLKMEDAATNLTYYLQDRFANKMNEYLSEYERMKNHEKYR
jgi:hypothetical protein